MPTPTPAPAPSWPGAPTAVPPGQVPPAAAATPDLICWMWAAVPPKNGRLHIARVADRLAVSDSTVRRWIARAGDLQFTAAATARLKQLAILRGHGTYLWPDLDPVTRARADRLARAAETALAVITDTPEAVPPTWASNGTLDPHRVWLLWYPAAHVYGVASGASASMARKTARAGDVLQEVTVENKYTAQLLTHRVLTWVQPHRCLPPSTLVPTGRTQTWRQAGGPVDLAAHHAEVTGTRRAPPSGAATAARTGPAVDP